MMNQQTSRIREWIVLSAGAAVYALLYALGSQIDQCGITRLSQTLVRFAVALPIALCVLYVLVRFVLPRIEMAPDRKGRKPFCTLGAFCVIFASFVPLFLIEFPGSYMYDTQTQVYQIVFDEYSTFHPLAHTLLLRACISLYDLLGSFEKCMAVCSLVTMTTMAACFSLFCASVSRSVSRSAARISVGFFCLYPAHMAFASNYVKDGVFAAFFALFIALCAEELRMKKLSCFHRAVQVIAGIMACLLRKNMIYAMMVWMAILLVQGRRQWRLALSAVLIAAVGYGANTGLAAITNAEKGTVAEMLSVPIQQLARTRLYADEVFTEEERALMDEVCTYDRYGFTQVWKRYEPTLADGVKNNLDTQVLSDKLGELAAMWLRMGKERPDIYLDAFLNLALPSLYPYSEYRVAQPYIEIGIQPGAVTAPYGHAPVTQPGRFSAVRSWLYENIYKTGMDGVPVVRYLFNTGFIYWLLLLHMLYAMYRGDWTNVLWMLLAVLLWGTYLLGPVMQGRYLYPFICVLPVFVLRPHMMNKNPEE